VRGADARKLNLRTISDAGKYAGQWRAGFGQDFKSRADGYPGMARAYGLKFAEEPREMDLSLTYIALASGKASARGEILNDLPDRISDVVIFIGAAHSGWMNPLIGYWAAIFALLTAYVGMFGQAVGVHREFSGVMSKPWRMVVLHLGAWTVFAAATFGGQPLDARHLGLTLLDWTCLIVIAGCIQTVFVRLRQTLRVLGAKKSPQLVEVP